MSVQMRRHLDSEAPTLPIEAQGYLSGPYGKTGDNCTPSYRVPWVICSRGAGLVLKIGGQEVEVGTPQEKDGIALFVDAILAALNRPEAP